MSTSFFVDFIRNQISHLQRNYTTLLNGETVDAISDGVDYAGNARGIECLFNKGVVAGDFGRELWLVSHVYMDFLVQISRSVRRVSETHLKAREVWAVAKFILLRWAQLLKYPPDE